VSPPSLRGFRVQWQDNRFYPDIKILSHAHPHDKIINMLMMWRSRRPQACTQSSKYIFISLSLHLNELVIINNSSFKWKLKKKIL
jgi:hypothetical protein